MNRYTPWLQNRKRKAGGPDGLEAWCVALSACFINFVMAGLGRMSGILYVAFIDIFQVDRMHASVPFSARSLTRNLFGPVVGILGQKYGVRATTLMGGIIGTISAASCFYANNILWITIMWGAINGSAAALTITLPQVILGQHFKKYRTTASGMAFSGGCVGSFLFPVLLEYLLHTYGLGGTFLVLAGIIMNVIPAAMVLRKPSWLNIKSKGRAEISTICQTGNKRPSLTLEERERNIAGDSSDKHVQKDESRGNMRFFSDTKRNLNGNFGVIDIEILRQNSRLIILLLTTNFADRQNENKCYSSLSTSDLQKELEKLYSVFEDAFSSDTSSKEIDKSVKPSEYNSDLELHCRKIQDSAETRKVILKIKRHTEIETRENISLILKRLLIEDMNNIVTLFPEDEHRGISKIIQQLRYIYLLLLECEKYDELTSDITGQNTSAKSNEKYEKEETVPHSNTFYAHTITAFRLHTNPLFLLISLCRSVHFITFVPAVTIIVDFSMDKGLLEEDGKYVIAALSFGDLMGRLCLGWVTDKEYVRLPRYMLLVMVLQGACTASLSLMQSKIALLSLIALFGLLQGSLFVRHPVLVTKYLSSHEQSVAMGCFNFFSGLLGFTLPSYIGYFRDTIGSYDYIFYINGAIGTFVGLLWIFEPFFVQCINRNNDPDKKSTV